MLQLLTRGTLPFSLAKGAIPACQDGGAQMGRSANRTRICPAHVDCDTAELVVGENRKTRKNMPCDGRRSPSYLRPSFAE
jgi:hypothetical protein